MTILLKTNFHKNYKRCLALEFYEKLVNDFVPIVFWKNQPLNHVCGLLAESTIRKWLEK